MRKAEITPFIYTGNTACWKCGNQCQGTTVAQRPPLANRDSKWEAVAAARAQQSKKKSVTSRTWVLEERCTSEEEVPEGWD